MRHPFEANRQAGAVQWTMEEDLTWSSVRPGGRRLEAGLDAKGRLIALHSAEYAPHQQDCRLTRALLAGMPCSTSKRAPGLRRNGPYDKIPNVLRESARHAQPGGGIGGGGLRGNIMRTPGQRQQVFALEG